MTKLPGQVIEELRENKRLKRQLEDEEIELAMEISREKMFYALRFTRTADPHNHAPEVRYYTKEALAVEVGRYLTYEGSKYVHSITTVGPSDVRALAEEDVVLDDMSTFKTKTIISIFRKGIFLAYFLIPDGVDVCGLLVDVGGLIEKGSDFSFSIDGGYVCSFSAMGSKEDILTRIKNIIK